MVWNYVGPDQDDWDQYLSTCEFAINNYSHKGLHTTPLNYGYHPKSTYITHSREASSAANPAAVKMKNDMQLSLASARAALKQAQDIANTMQTNTDEKSTSMLATRYF